MKELSPEDKMIKARVQLLLNHPFFGYFLTHLRFKCTDSITRTAAVQYSRKSNQYLDFLYYNPEFISRLSTAEVMGLEVHEMLHILMMQEQRRGQRDERRWYVSSEIAVNDTALKSGFTLPGDADENLKGILPDGKTEGKSVEEIYDLLPTTLKVEIPLHVICLDERTREGQNEDETGSLQGIPKFISEKELKSMISEAVAYAKMYGKMPAGLELFVDDILTPKANWREILWRYTSREFITDYTYASPNRRYVQYGVYLPGVLREGIELAVCVDTSGSIDQHILSEFFAEINGIVASYEKVSTRLIECDTEVTGVYEIDDRNINEIKFKGGGGTAFGPALEKASEFNTKLCVYLTDGFGSFPQEAPSFPVIWALTSREVQVPFGTSVIIE
jgi:predicted metal-dependent peptidase